MSEIDLGALSVGVVGAGTMGRGIAIAFARRGAGVIVVDADTARAEAAVARIRDRIAGGGEGPPATSVRPSAVRAGTGPADVGGCDVVVEAVPEDAALKVAVLSEVERGAGGAALLATTTSALPVGELAVALRHAGRFCGMHFFNPVPSSAVVEVVPHAGTSAATLEHARACVTALGLRAVIARDSPGFASTRLGVALGLEAMRTVEEGVASAEDVDTLMTLGYRHATGPLRTTDLVGLDVRLAVAEHLAATLGPRFAPPRILREKVARGELGRKAGRGFYDWRADGLSAERP